MSGSALRHQHEDSCQGPPVCTGCGSPPQQRNRGMCRGCGRFRTDLSRGRPAVYLPGMWTGQGWCLDCIRYLEKAYSDLGQPGFIEEPHGKGC